MCYPKSVSFIEFRMELCIYDDIIQYGLQKKLLYFKLSKSGQILHVDKIDFPGLVTYKGFIKML